MRSLPSLIALVDSRKLTVEFIRDVNLTVSTSDLALSTLILKGYYIVDDKFIYRDSNRFPTNPLVDTVIKEL